MQQSELDLETFVAGLRQQPEPEQPEELDLDTFVSGLKADTPSPGLPGALSRTYSAMGRNIAGTAMGFGSQLAGFAGKVIDLPQTLLGGVTGPATPAASKPGAQLVAPVEQALSQAGEDFFPQAERERQGMPGQILSTFTQMGLAGPAVAAGAPAAAFVFAAQNAMPAYYEVLKKTGSEEKANQALWANSAIGQLEFFGGGEKLAGSIIRKLTKGEVGKAIQRGVLHFVTTQGRETGTELAQQGLSDLLRENLTGEDLANWERLKQTAPVALIASAPFAVVDAAISRGASEATTQPRTTQAEVSSRQAQTQPALAGEPSASQATTTEAPVVPVSSTVESPFDILQRTAKKTTSIQERIQEEHQLHAKSLEELDALEEEILSEKKRLGIRQLERQLDKAEAAGATDAELRAMLTPEQEGFFYYTESTKYPDIEHIRDVRRAVADARFAETPKELSQALKYRMGELSALLGEEGAAGRPLKDNEVRALAVFREAQEKAQAEGWNFSEVMKSAAVDYAGRFSDPADAEFMLEGFLQRAEQGKKKPPNELKLLRGKEKAEAGGFPSPAPAEAAPETALAPEDVTTTPPSQSQAPVESTGTVPEAEPLREKLDEAMGAPEVAPPEEAKATGIKNATVEKELTEMGLPLPKGAERTSFVELHGKAMETFQKDQASGSRLVDELAAHPRAPSGEEDALLSLELNRRINEREAAEEAFIKDPSEVNKARVEKAKTDYAKAADVTKAAGSKSGISLAARKMMVARDYSLAAMERAIQVAKGGKELTEQESSRVKELHKKIAETQKKYEEYVSAAEARQAEMEAENAMLKEKKSLLSKTRRKDREAKIRESKKKIDEIINKLASGQQAAAGLDPAKIGLTVQLAAEHIRLGYQSFALWSEEMVTRIGEHIRPYLRPAWDQAKQEEEQAMLKSYKSRKETDIAKLKERTKAKQFELKRRVTPIEKDKEAIRLKAEYEGAKRQFEAEKAKHERKNRTLAQKALAALAEPIHFTKAFITAYDVSAVFRQGGFFTLGHPLLAAKHAKRMFGAMFSAKKALEIDTEIRSRQLHPFGEASGLQLTSLDEGLGPQEEAIRSHLSDYLPGIKASNRAYITFLNLQRSAIFDSIVQGLPDTPTLDQGRAIANLVNVGSGRGNPGKFTGAMEGAALALWSPRLLLSRFQLLAGQPAWKKGARKAVAKEYARFLVGVAGLYALAKLFDADIEDDPRSSDFGKIRIGKTRIDPLAGLSQVFVLMTRLISGETKSSISGKVRPIRGEKREFKDKTAAEIIGTFLRTKASPVVGTAIDVLSGENVIGEKVTGKSLAKNLLVPMTIRDTKEAMEELGVPAGAAAGVVAAFGMSVQTYGGKKRPNK